MKLSFDFQSNGVRTLIGDIDAVTAAHKRMRAQVEKPMRSPRTRGAGARGGKSPEVQAAEQEMKQLERINAKRAASETRLARYREGVKYRSMMAAQRMGERAEKAELARIARVELAQKRASAASRAGMARGVGAAISGIGGAGMLIGGAAIATMGTAYYKRALIREQAQALSVQARGAGEKGVDPRLLAQEATRTAISVRGTKTSDVLTGMSKFVGLTGSIEGARDHANTFATVARATGGTEEDVAATAASYREKFGIVDDDQMRLAMARTIQGGKSGAFEMKDFSQFATEMGAAGSRFGLDKGVEGVSTLSGLAQISMKSAGNGAKASTGLQAMLRQLVAKGGAGKESIKALTGANVFTDSSHRQTRDVKDVLTDVIGGAGGDQTKLQKIFGDEGMVGVSALVTAFNEAATAAGKDASASEKRAAGEAAVREMLQKNIEAGGTWADVQQDAAAATDNASSKLTTAWEAASAAMGEALVDPMNAVAEAIQGIDWNAVGAGVGFLVEALAAAAEAIGAYFPDKQKVKRDPSPFPVTELKDTEGELAALDKKKTKTPEEYAKARKLRARRDVLQKEVDDPNNPAVMRKFDMEAEANGYMPGKGPLLPVNPVSLTDAGAGGGKGDYTMPVDIDKGNGLQPTPMNAETLAQLNGTSKRHMLLNEDSAFDSFINLARNDLGLDKPDQLQGGLKYAGTGGDVPTGQLKTLGSVSTGGGFGEGDGGTAAMNAAAAKLAASANQLDAAAQRITRINSAYPEP